MAKEDSHEGNRGDPVDDRGDLWTAQQIHDVLGPALIGEKHRGSGQDQHHDGDRQHTMGDSPAEAEAAEIDLGRIVRIGTVALALPTLAPLAVDPQQHVCPEEDEDADDQDLHEAGGDPHLGIVFVIIGIAVGMEAKEPLGRAFMTLSTGLQTVVGVDLGARIIDIHDAVAAMTVETLGGVGIAQTHDLTVVRLPVGRDLLLVTASAVFGNGELDLVPVG